MTKEVFIMAKKRKMAAMLLLMFCFVSVGVLATPHSVYAKKINSMKEAEKLARKKVKNATIVESDKDYEKGVLIYEIEMVKGTKEYNLTYRASDGKLIEYGWEQHKLDRSSRKKKMSESKCRSLAQKKVPGASITAFAWSPPNMENSSAPPYAFTTASSTSRDCAYPDSPLPCSAPEPFPPQPAKTKSIAAAINNRIAFFILYLVSALPFFLFQVC